MRLPMVMMGGAQPDELQQAISRLTEAQGRAYQMWLEALGGMGRTAADAMGQTARRGDGGRRE